MKKFILFIFMALFYSVSSAATPENKSVGICNISEKTKETFISELTAQNPNVYYIYTGKTSAVDVYQQKNDENNGNNIVSKVKDIFIKENFSKDFESVSYEIIQNFYEIATDVNRSLRN